MTQKEDAERAAFDEWWNTGAYFKAGDSNGWEGVALLAWQSRAALDASAEPDGYAFKCEGQLWVVTDHEVAMKWREQGFEVTPVTRPDADKRDAERYRWLRTDGFVPSDFEKQIDAALSQASKGNGND